MKKIIIMSGLIVGLMSNAFAFDLNGMVSKAIIDKHINNEKPVKSIAKSLIQEVLNKNTQNSHYVAQMENSPEWKELVKIIYDGTQLMNQNMQNAGIDFSNCSSKRESFADNENKFFLFVSDKIPKVHGSLTEFLNVNSYSQLSKFNINKNVNVSYMPYHAAVAYSINKKNDNIAKNLSAIALDDKLMASMEQIYRDANRDHRSDLQDLYSAAVYDMATLGYLIRMNQYRVKLEDYVASMLTMYARDKFMCVFD